jgi:pectinesterase
MSWSSLIRQQPDAWFDSPQAAEIAERMLLYQRDCGGWPKNTEMHRPLEEPAKAALLQLKSRTDDATTDNGATTQELLFLARLHRRQPRPQYREAFARGVQYLIEAQYPNGGWPQFYPLRPGYYTHITFNDNSMANILRLMRDIARGTAPYETITDPSVTGKAQAAFDKGIECILNTQYVQQGVLTVWCAQHDERTLLPATARSYELPSLSGSESVGLVQLLMELDTPSPRVIRSVEAAIAWFEKVRIPGLKRESFVNDQGQYDYRMVAGAGGPDLWARFYTLEDNRAFFCDRDGVMKFSLSEIGHERRNGYSWYGTWPAQILSRYPEWKKKWTNPAARP